MTISPDQIQRIASLVRLELDEREAHVLAEQLGEIVGQLEVLRRADLAGEDDGLAAGAIPLREDEPGADPLHLPLADLAPEWRDGFYLAPGVAGLGEGGAGE